MDLPSLSVLNEFNRVLLAISQLSDMPAGCKIRSVINLCSSFTLGGHAFNHYETLRICHFAGLVSMSRGKVKIRELGKELLGKNPLNSYEITDQQKEFIAENLILEGPWMPRARDLFSNFNPNYEKFTYDMVFDERLEPRHSSTIHLLLALRVLFKEDSKLIVEAKYVSNIRKLRTATRGFSEEELEKVLQANMKLADQTEEAVLEYERSRLRSLNRNAEASLVRRISKLDTRAGYDIESFDGDKPLYDFDRFIEVKSSYRSELRFFWTENERRVAEEKGDKYWIYFVGGLSSEKPKLIAPIIIQNPHKRLAEVSTIQTRAATYVVEQMDNMPLRESVQGELTSYIL